MRTVSDSALRDDSTASDPTGAVPPFRCGLGIGFIGLIGTGRNDRNAPLVAVPVDYAVLENGHSARHPYGRLIPARWRQGADVVRDAFQLPKAPSKGGKRLPQGATDTIYGTAIVRRTRITTTAAKELYQLHPQAENLSGAAWSARYMGTIELVASRPKIKRPSE